MRSEEVRVPALRFPEFSGEWREVKLESLVIIERGASPRPINQYITEDENGINWIKIGDIAPNSKYITKTVEKITQAGAKKSREVQPNDFVLSNSMSFGRPYISKIYGCIHDGWLLMRNRQTSQLLNSFLFEIMSTNIVKKQLLSMAAGSAVKNLKSENVKKVKISIPSLPEQKKIADFLSAVDEKITLSQEKITRLEAYKKGMMQKLLSGEVRFPGFTDAWEYKSLETYINLITGFPFKSSEILEENTGVPLLRGINITEGYIRHSPEIDRFYGKNIDEKIGKYIVKENDLVLAMDGSKVGKNVALVDNKNSGSLLVQRVARIRAKKYADIRYIYQNIFSDTFRKYVDVVNTSSGIPHISSKQINEFTMWFPSIKEQQKIADFLTAIDDKLTLEKERLEALKRYKQGLLQKMFV